MRPPLIVPMALLLFVGAVSAAALPPECASPSSTCQFVFSNLCAACNLDVALSRLYDDGLHGDGGALDGLYGVDVLVDQPAGVYSWNVGNRDPFFGLAQPTLPYCWCSAPQVGYPRVWTTGPGEVIHFALDTRNNGGGWIPSQGVATSKGHPTSSPLAVMFDIDPYVGTASLPLYPAAQSNGVWEVTVTVPAAGGHVFAFSPLDRSVLFTDTYNTTCGSGCSPGEQHLPNFGTAAPFSDVRFEFDESSGRMRATVLGVTPTTRRSWGRLKSVYR